MRREKASRALPKTLYELRKYRELPRLNIVITLIFLLLGCSKSDESIVLSNNELSDVKPLTEVVEYLYEKPEIDEEVIEKIEFIIQGKIVVVRALNPEITNLKELVQKDLSVLQSDEINTIISKMEQIISQINTQKTGTNN